jgi:hypothetical protein
LGFGGTARRTVFGVKVDDQWMALAVGQGEVLATGSRQAEIGNGLLDHEGLSQSHGWIVVRKAVIGQVACY